VATAVPPEGAVPTGVVPLVETGPSSTASSARRLSRSRPPSSRNRPTPMARLKSRLDTNTAVGETSRPPFSTTPFTVTPYTLIGEKPPAWAPCTTIIPISRGLIR
jgi:hypothetical protein